MKHRRQSLSPLSLEVKTISNGLVMSLKKSKMCDQPLTHQLRGKFY